MRAVLPARGRHRDGFSRPVAAFVGACGAGYHPHAAHGGPTALQALRRDSLALLLAAHSQCFGFGPAAPRRPRASPRAPKTPSQVSGGLRPAGHVASKRLLAGPPRMSEGSLRHSHPARCRAGFPRAERRSSRVPIGCGLFAVRYRLRRDSLASAYGFAPLVVELFPAAVCRAVPGP